MPEFYPEPLIMEALDERLKTFAWTDPLTQETVDASLSRNIQWPGVKFRPDPEVSYLRPTFHKPLTLTNFRGHPVLSSRKGRYEIQCRRPQRFGDYAAVYLASAVARHFFPGTGENLYLATSGNEMIIQIEEDPDVGLNGSNPESNFVVASCQVKYLAQVPRSS